MNPTAPIRFTDIFDLEDHFEELGDKGLQDAFNRVRDWGTEEENDNEKLRPIVNGLRNAISLIFEKEDWRNPLLSLDLGQRGRPNWRKSLLRKDLRLMGSIIENFTIYIDMLP